MQEFATRTHQQGVAELAKDYRPAPIDQAVMPIRVEKWLGHGKIKYRVVGILWGGSRLLKALESVSTRKKPTCAWILFRALRTTRGASCHMRGPPKLWEPI